MHVAPLALNAVVTHLPLVHVLPVPHWLFAVHAAHAIVIVGDALALVTAQYPLTQLVFIVHTAPFALSAVPVTHLPLVHILPVPHWLSAVHGAHALVIVGEELALVTAQYPLAQSAFVVQSVAVPVPPAEHPALHVARHVLHAESLPAGFAMHLHWQLPLVQSALAVQLPAAVPDASFPALLSGTIVCIAVPVFTFEAGIWSSLLPKNSLAKLAETEELSSISATSIAVIIFVFIFTSASQALFSWF